MPKAPYLALLGDIGNVASHKDDCLAFLTRQLNQFRAVLFILGNHEAYYSNWPETLDILKRTTPGGVVYRLGSLYPELAETVFVADGARIIGQVTMGAESSVWFGAVMRGDNGPIRIGNGSNVQDCAILHSHPGGSVALGAYVSVGHQSIIHGCTIADRVLIGMQAVIMDGVELAEDTIVAAGSVVPMHKKYPPGVLLQGAPAKVVRQLSSADIEYIERNALEYVERSRRYARELARA